MVDDGEKRKGNGDLKIRNRKEWERVRKGKGARKSEGKMERREKRS